MLTIYRFSNGPDLSVVSDLNVYSRQRTRRRSVKDVAGVHIECTFMTRTFKPIVLLCVIHRTRQMRTFLFKRIKIAVRGPDQDRRVIFFRKRKIEGTAGASVPEPLIGIGVKTSGEPAEYANFAAKPAEPRNNALDVRKRKLQNSRLVTSASSSRSYGNSA